MSSSYPFWTSLLIGWSLVSVSSGSSFETDSGSLIGVSGVEELELLPHEIRKIVKSDSNNDFFTSGVYQ